MCTLAIYLRAKACALSVPCSRVNVAVDAVQLARA